MPAVPVVIEIATSLLAFLACLYCIFALWSARAYLRQRRESLADFSPAVSILKPLKGTDPDMYESFASHCRQDYPAEYEILFAVGSASDPAAAIVERLVQDFPKRRIELVVCPEKLGTNGKVSNLAQAYSKARFDYILINDSDIVVSPAYLRRTMAAFAKQGPANGKVGMVTALYRGRPHKGLWSRIESLWIATEFVPGLLTAMKMEGGIHFGLGSTLAVSREALEISGGFSPLLNTLADDYELGRQIDRCGYEILVGREVVETSVPDYEFNGFAAHQLRWARTIRDARRWQHAGMIVTYALPWALLNVVASGVSLESMALLSVTAAIRAALALAVGVGVLGDRQVLRDLWLLPLRDLVALGVWAWSLSGNTVHWRGEEFYLKHGKLTRVM